MKSGVMLPGIFGPMGYDVFYTAWIKNQSSMYVGHIWRGRSVLSSYPARDKAGRKKNINNSKKYFQLLRNNGTCRLDDFRLYIKPRTLN